MKCNVAALDRFIRFFLGTLLSTWAFSGGPNWAFFGIYLLFTSGWGFCLFYALLQINTIKDLENSNQLMSPPENDR
jgi:hypothetical protein